MLLQHPKVNSVYDKGIHLISKIVLVMLKIHQQVTSSSSMAASVPDIPLSSNLNPCASLKFCAVFDDHEAMLTAYNHTFLN